MITVSKEDYLKAILEAEAEGENVISATLAHWLSVSAPAVTMALRRLKKDGLVTVRPEGRVELTRAGREVARRTALRHHLIERMLHEIFGMEWYKVHDEAEHLEHAVSADFEAKLVSKVGRSGVCPHGNPVVPEAPRIRRRRGQRLLSEGEDGHSYSVASVYERDGQLQEFLEHRGIRPGARIRVLSRSYDETLTIETDAGQITIGAPAAEKVWISSTHNGARRFKDR